MLYVLGLFAMGYQNFQIPKNMFLIFVGNRKTSYYLTNVRFYQTRLFDILTIHITLKVKYKNGLFYKIY